MDSDLPLSNSEIVGTGEHPIELLAFPPYEIKPRGNGMNIKCALLGHDWATHNTEYDFSGINFLKLMFAVIFSVTTAGLLAPIFNKAGWFSPEEYRDATCTRCNKMIFHAEDMREKLKAREIIAYGLKVRHEKMATLRNKARG